MAQPIQFSGRKLTSAQLDQIGTGQPVPLNTDLPLPNDKLPDYSNNKLSAMRLVGNPNAFNGEPLVPVKGVPEDKDTEIPVVNINIINDYDWTYSENKKRYEELNQEGIPRIELMEMRIKASTMLSKLRSLISSGGDITSAFTGSTKDIVNAVATAIDLPGAGEVINNAVGKAGGLLEKVAREIEKLVGKYGTGYIPNGNPQSEFLKPYSQLYLTEPTNIKYTLPYFDNEFLSVSNDFSDYASKTGISDNPTVIENLIKNSTNLIDNVAGSALSLAQVAQPGVYVERPKFYNFDSLAESITIKFPLLNTLNVGAYKRNLEFINRLVLMNKPHRINKVLVDPPAIYSINQTGVAYYPYAYISRLSVTHVGTKRIIGSDVVPDAFLITITLQPLTSNANNYMLMNDNSPIIGRHNDTFGPIKLFVKQTSGPASVEPKPDKPAINPKQDYGGGGTNLTTVNNQGPKLPIEMTPSSRTGFLPNGKSMK